MFLNVVGELDYGRRAMGGSLDMGADLGSRQVAWFKRQLADDPPAELEGPHIALFVQGVNRWRDEDDWPLAPRAPPTGSSSATAGSRPRRLHPTTVTTRSCSTRSTRARRAAAIW